MGYQSLEDYIATLSESEKVKYEALIHESRQRKITITNNCAAMRENLYGLCESLKDNLEIVMELGTLVRQLKINVLRINSKSGELGLFLKLSEEPVMQHNPQSLN